jgi:hypothetical protein
LGEANDIGEKKKNDTNGNIMKRKRKRRMLSGCKSITVVLRVTSNINELAHTSTPISSDPNDEWSVATDDAICTVAGAIVLYHSHHSKSLLIHLHLQSRFFQIEFFFNLS